MLILETLLPKFTINLVCFQDHVRLKAKGKIHETEPTRVFFLLKRNHF